MNQRNGIHNGWRPRGFSGIVPSCSHGYFVGHKFFLVGISWVQNFFSWVILLFSVVDSMKKSSIEISQTMYSIPNRFQQM